jgi:hypothetical protein
VDRGGLGGPDRPTSARRTTLWASSPACGLGSSPSLDFGSEPKLDAAAAQLDDRARHVGVASLVEAHAVAVGEAESVGDQLRVDQVVGLHEWSHVDESTLVDGSVRHTE